MHEKRNMSAYPIIVNLDDRLVVVVGGGEVALRKVQDLLEAGALVRLVSPKVHPDLLELEKKEPHLKIINREYMQGDCRGAVLVFTATGSSEANRKVFMEAREKGIFINAADDPSNCTFYVPSMMRRGDLLVAVSTGGSSPAMAARLKRVIEKSVPENIAEILEALKQARRILQSHDDFREMDFTARGELLKMITNDEAMLHELVTAGKNGEMASWLLNRTR